MGKWVRYLLGILYIVASLSVVAMASKDGYESKSNEKCDAKISKDDSKEKESKKSDDKDSKGKESKKSDSKEVPSKTQWVNKNKLQ